MTRLRLDPSTQALLQSKRGGMRPLETEVLLLAAAAASVHFGGPDGVEITIPLDLHGDAQARRLRTRIDSTTSLRSLFTQLQQAYLSAASERDVAVLSRDGLTGLVVEHRLVGRAPIGVRAPTISYAHGELSARGPLAAPLTMLEAVEQRLRQALLEPDVPLSTLDVISERTSARMCAYGQPEQTLELTTTVVEEFYAVAAAVPEKTALQSPSEGLSYGELARRADRLAAVLVAEGCGPAHRILLSLEKSIELVVATIAVLRVGATLVLVDPSTPESRRARLAVAAGVSCTILHPGEVRDRIMLGVDVSTSLPRGFAELDSEAFILFTSGSTGEPKGVLQTHRCLANVVTRQRLYAGIADNQRVLQYSSIGFDVYVAHELFFALCGHGTLVIPDERWRHDLGSLGRFMVRQAVTFALLPVSVLDTLLQVSEELRTSSTLEHLACAGEQLIVTEALSAFSRQYPDLVVHNFYGPSETHNATNYRAKAGDLVVGRPVPIGMPALNTWIFLVDERDEPTPPGQAGEVLIGGAGLAEGYLDDPEQTATRFVSNPFPAGGPRLYRSGDLARWDDDGRLWFLGRKDGQVKVRGNRVEINAIEVLATGLAGVRDAVVLAVPAAEGGVELVLYYRGASTPTELRNALAHRVDDYLVPSHILRVDAYPLTSSGKVDRVRLQGVPRERAIVATWAHPVEETMARLWAQVLGHGNFDGTSDFFSVGGHSLRAIRLLVEVEREFGVRLSWQDLRDASTLVGLSDKIRVLVASSRDVRASPPTLSSDSSNDFGARRPMTRYCHDLLAAAEGSRPDDYHLVEVADIEGCLDHERLVQAFGELVEAQEILRTTFHVGGSRPYQQLHPFREDVFTIGFHDLGACADSDLAFAALVKRATGSIAGTAKLPLVALHHARLGTDRDALILAAHHVVLDGPSLEQFLDRLSRAYAGERPKPESPVAIIEWERSRDWTHEREFWREFWRDSGESGRFVSVPSDLDESQSRLATITRTQDGLGGALLELSVSTARLERARRACGERRATLFELFLIAAWRTLSREFGVGDGAVGVVVNPRVVSGFPDLMGHCANVIPLVFKGEDSLGSIQRKLGSALLHAALPTSAILDLGRRPGHGPQAFGLLFSSHAGRPVPGLAWMLRSRARRSVGSKAPLTLNWWTDGERAAIQAEFEASRYSERLVVDLLQRCEAALAEVER